MSTLALTWVWPMPSRWYSIGSSTVRMFRVRSLSVVRLAYRVVVLPEPVGPVTSRMPCGLRTVSSISLRSRSLMPRCCRFRRPACLSSRRSTTRSPLAEGRVETRMSTSRPPTRREIRPSWGIRFSAMSSRAMTLIRDTSRAASSRLGSSTSRSTPSTRKRTTRRFSKVSRWMSEAFSRIASPRIALIRRMIGASSSCSIRSSVSGTWSASAARSRLPPRSSASCMAAEESCW
ncbi:hypothetical protein PAERUG_P53_London_9_VIM_2_02_13_03224 [Pseudomonas aeruginosa]|nr:hypothetical protein PAERUG_P53_London_9_VIM_2_02_13_03224 [Pseudomonas aeruginosa]CRX14340.1 hypothetical protein PAERUG_P54_1_London_24_VIM_2_04_13_02919 [Pseudomonas aeruginosa]